MLCLNEIIQYCTKVKRGERLKQPKLCTDTVWDLAKKCWNVAPEERPSFSNIKSTIESIYTNVDSYNQPVYGEPMPESEQNSEIPIAEDYVAPRN